MELLRENRYNYFADLVRLTKGLQEDSDDKLTNTLELFAFGTLKDYNSHRDMFLPLDTGLKHHLTKLSILGLCNDYEGASVDTPSILAQYGLESDDVLSALFSLVDDGVVEVKVDELKSQWHIGPCSIIRDSFDTSLYTLKALKEEEIPKRSLQYAHSFLAGWYQQKLAKKYKSIVKA